MLIAGINKSRIHGARSKNLSRLAYPKSSMLVSGNTNNRRLVRSKKTMMAM
jgi:hypothetical protein